MSERRRDTVTRDRIGWLQHGWEHTSKLLWRAMLILYVAAIVGGYFLWQYGRSVQDARYDAAFNACRSSNGRHDRTITQLRTEARRLEKDASSSRRVRIEASVQTNIRLIDVMIPVHKAGRGKRRHSACRLYAQRVVDGDPRAAPFV